MVGLEVAIKASNLTKYYGDFKAVDRLNFEVYDSEIFGLLGPNGAGKTTTLLMITTVIKPTEGTVTVYGRDVRREPNKVRELVGIAFQDPKLYWVQSPLNILTWHAKVCGLRGSEVREKVEEVMKSLDIWEVRRKRAHDLSGGMKKRVEVAKVLIQEPKIAIFDEPTSQIDVSGKHFIWSAIRELRDKGSTIILATNDLNEADRLSDRVCIMHRGGIVALDSPGKLKDSIVGGDLIEFVVDKTLPKDLVEEIRGMENVFKLKVSGRSLRIYLNRAEELAPKIISKLHRGGVTVKSMNMREPSLDDVFLHYTGLTIREAEMGVWD